MLPPLHTLSLSLRCCAPVPTGVNLQESANGTCPLCSGPMQLTFDTDDGGILSELMDPRLPALVEETHDPKLGDQGLRQWASPTAVLGNRRYHRRCLVTFYAQERNNIAADARTGKRATISNNPYVRFPEAADERTQQQKNNKELPHYAGHPTEADINDIDADTRSMIMGTGSAAFKKPYTLEQLTDQEQEMYQKAINDVDALDDGEHNLLSAQGAADRAQLRAHRSSFWEKQAVERARDAVRGTPQSAVQTLIDERLEVVRKHVEAQEALNLEAVRRAQAYAEAEVKVAQSEAAWAQQAVKAAQSEAAAANEAAREEVKVAQGEAVAAAAADAAIKVRNAQTERTQAVRAAAAAEKGLEKARNANTASAELNAKLQAKIIKARQDLVKAKEELEKAKKVASLSAKESAKANEANLETIRKFEEKLIANTAEMEELKKAPNPAPAPNIDTDSNDDAGAKQLDASNAGSKGLPDPAVPDVTLDPNLNVTEYTVSKMVVMPILQDFFYEKKDKLPLMMKGKAQETLPFVLSTWVEMGLKLPRLSLLRQGDSYAAALDVIMQNSHLLDRGPRRSPVPIMTEKCVQRAMLTALGYTPTVDVNAAGNEVGNEFTSPAAEILKRKTFAKTLLDMDQQIGFPPGHIAAHLDGTMLRNLWLEYVTPEAAQPTHLLHAVVFDPVAEREAREAAAEEEAVKAAQSTTMTFTEAWMKHVENAVGQENFVAGRDTPVAILNEFLNSSTTKYLYGVDLIKQARKDVALRRAVFQHYESRRSHRNDVNNEHFVDVAFDSGKDYLSTMQLMAQTFRKRSDQGPLAYVFYEGAELVLQVVTRAEIRAQTVYPMEKRSNPYAWPVASQARDALVYYYYQPLHEEEIQKVTKVVPLMVERLEEIMALQDVFKRMIASMKNSGATMNAISNKLTKVVDYLQRFRRSFEQGAARDVKGFTPTAKVEFLALLKDLRLNLDAIKFLKREIPAWYSSIQQPDQLDNLEAKLKRKSGKDGVALIGLLFDLLEALKVRDGVPKGQEGDNVSAWDVFGELLPSFFKSHLYDPSVMELFNEEEPTWIGTKSVMRWVLETRALLVKGEWERVVSFDPPTTHNWSISHLDNWLRVSSGTD